jgi:hypothetical protein
MPGVKSKLIAINHILFMRLMNFHYLLNIIQVLYLTLSPHILLGFVSQPVDGGKGFLPNVYAYLLTLHSIRNGNLLSHHTENLKRLTCVKSSSNICGIQCQ